MIKKALVALALFMLPVAGAFAQTAGQSVSGFLLAPAGTYNGYTCPATNIGPCFVQYGSSVPTSPTAGTTGDINVKQVNGSTVNVGVGASSTGTQRVTTSTDSTIGTVTTITNPVAVTVAAAPLNPIGITPTDRTITSASGSSETVMAANASRHSLIIQNTGNANCGVNPTGGTAVIGGAGTLTLLPGGSYQPRIPTLSAVTAICTAGQPLYGEEN